MNILKKHSVFVITLLCVTVLSGCYKLPSEKSLLKRFNNNRDGFESLIEVVDGEARLSDNYGNIEKKLGIRNLHIWEFKNIDQKTFVFYIGRSVVMGVLESAS